MPTTILTLTNPQIEALHSQIVAIYRAAFTVPPYNKPEAEVAAFARALPTQLDRAAFRFVGAFEPDTRRLVGFAYGYTSAAGQWWYETVKLALPEPAASYWLANTFQFVEIAVAPQAQGQGIGGRLHDHLLQGLEHDRAILSTLQAETVAHHLYRARGWVTLRQDFFFPGVERRYQIMGLEFKI
jgi:GNAT superfamily N-acetyltransferase